MRRDCYFSIIMFDNYYISCLNYLKPILGKKAIQLTYWYICILELSFYALLISFFAAFTSQMNIQTLDRDKVVILLILGTLFICFKNWMRYNGKRRNVLSASSRKNKIKGLLLWLAPLLSLLLSVLFYQAI